MSTDDTAVISPESATGQAEPSTTPVETQDAGKAVPSEREKLIKALTEGTVEKLDMPDEKEPVAEADKAEGDEKTVEAVEGSEASPEKVEGKKEAVETATQKTETKTPEADVEDDEKVSDDDVVKDSSRTRKRITKLREQAAF